MSNFRQIWVVFFGTCALLWAGSAAAQVLVVLSEETGVYRDTAETFRAELARLSPRHSVSLAPLKDLGSLAGYQLVVTVGNQAARGVAALGPHPPAIHSLLPRTTYERIPGITEGRDTAILLDQPASRQIDLIRLALPAFNRLALLEGRDSHELIGQIADAARQRRMTVARELVLRDGDLYPALQRVTAEPSVLVATPDSDVFNSYSLQNVLLATYRQRSPVLGFSPAYVRAGAVLGLYVTPAQVGRQVAEMAKVILTGGAVPPPQAPRYFEVGTNPQVAHSLGIDLEEAETLRGRLATLEGLAP